jgi:1,4-dihydroxy-2-naphthoate octaprenyltransferase
VGGFLDGAATVAHFRMTPAAISCDATRPSTARIWLAASRPRTLPAAVAPVLLGSALAWRAGHFVAPAAGGCLAFALLVQIGTNFANDYFDFIKGADTPARVGPRRAVAAGLVRPAVMRNVMLVVFGAAFLVGLTLLHYGGWPLLVIGVASIVSGVAYTGGPWPLGYHGLGDVFVFVFFGLVAVGATCFVQTGRVTAATLVAAAGVGALATNILLVNNYRDADTDARADKRTLVVRLGRPFARGQFTASLALALAVPVGLALLDHEPRRLLSAVPLTLLLAWPAARQRAALHAAQTPADLITLLGHTGLYLALYAIALSAWLVVA